MDSSRSTGKSSGFARGPPKFDSSGSRLVKSWDEGGKVERRGNTGGKESREEENVAMKDGKEIRRKRT